MEFKVTELPDTNIPASSLTRDDIAKEIPGLLSLYDEFPQIIYTASDPLFETISPSFNRATTTRPLAVVRALEESHVQATIKAVQAAGLQFAIRSGGAEMEGRNFRGIGSGVMIDTRSLCSIKVAEDKRSAVIGGGTIAGDLALALSREGAFTPVGWHPRLGYAGWSMAGGYGMYASSYGLGVDHILGVRIVLADGSVAVADENSNQDLLWALRGAGNGIWGVVTQFTIKTYPAPKLLIGSVKFAKKDWPAVMAEWAKNIEPNLPEELAGDIYFRNNVLELPEMNILFAWCAKEGDDLKKGWEHFEKIKSLPGADVVRIGESDFATFLMTELTIQPGAFECRGVITKGLTERVASVLMNQWNEDPMLFMGIPSHFVHGKAAQPNPGSCFNLRYRHRLFPAYAHHVVLTRTKEGDDIEIGAITKTMDAIKATGDVYVGASYGNLIDSSNTDWEVTYGKENLNKLKELKKKYDPTNFFSRGYPVLV
ncbi:hypothetical protein TGAMA5MH_04573 [Trichoderma gamsii]|uniref:FAD-binding PCMH-type domain-containing protein n=1 Tax=Trichoderma gamsii TaxID=398673 RepID=A0A2K0TDK2_9HYPO|nr:hypothetical protein TGAMA5MH_04573 [Trichoderma gamsii]